MSTAQLPGASPSCQDCPEPRLTAMRVKQRYEIDHRLGLDDVHIAGVSLDRRKPCLLGTNSVRRPLGAGARAMRRQQEIANLTRAYATHEPCGAPTRPLSLISVPRVSSGSPL